METTVDKHGRTTVPVAIRKCYHIQPGDRLVWLDDGQSIRVVPASGDPIHDFRGHVRGEGLLERLLEDRRGERQREL